MTLTEPVSYLAAIFVYILQNFIYAVWKRARGTEFPINGFVLGVVLSLITTIGIAYVDGYLATESLEALAASLAGIWGVSQGIYNLSLTIPKFFEARAAAKAAGAKKPLLNF